MKPSVLVRKINRKLAPDGRKLRKTRGAKHSLGDYYLYDTSLNCVVARPVDPEALGRELGVIPDDCTPAVRKEVMEYLKSKAAYRASMADKDKPWDWGGAKNASYAESLHRMVDYVSKLPDDDPTLRKLAACEKLSGDGGFEAPKDRDGQSYTDSAAIHCGPRGKVIEWADCAEWFASWAETAIEEASNIESDYDDC